MSVGVCLLVGQTLRAFVPTLAFTLGWTHSIEKTSWEEDWLVVDAGLALAEARIEGSGAGMEPPEGAVLRDGVWHYAPPASTRLHQSLSLTVSPYAQPYRFCFDGRCRPLAALAHVSTPFAVVRVERCVDPADPGSGAAKRGLTPVFGPMRARFDNERRIALNLTISPIPGAEP